MTMVVSERPEVIDLLPLETYNSSAWTTLLSRCPDNERLINNCPWDQLCGKNWASLLFHRSEFKDRCPWHKLSRHDLDHLSLGKPSLRINAVAKLDTKCVIRNYLKQDLWRFIHRRSIGYMYRI